MFLAVFEVAHLEEAVRFVIHDAGAVRYKSRHPGLVLAPVDSVLERTAVYLVILDKFDSFEGLVRLKHLVVEIEGLELLDAHIDVLVLQLHVPLNLTEPVQLRLPRLRQLLFWLLLGLRRLLSLPAVVNRLH